MEGTQRDTGRFVVLCDCDDELHPTIVAWIDDHRRSGGRIRFDSNHNYMAVGHKDFSGSTFHVGHKACGRGVRINDADAGELLDAVIEISTQVRGQATIPVPHHSNATVTEHRVVIRLEELCLVNGGLRRRKTRPTT